MVSRKGKGSSFYGGLYPRCQPCPRLIRPIEASLRICLEYVPRFLTPCPRFDSVLLKKKARKPK